MYVYLLLDTTETRTYVGATIDMDRRLQQHNGIKAGGAKATKARQWTRVCAIAGCPTWSTTLQLEWKWKQLTRHSCGHTPLVKRLVALKKLLDLERSTKTALPFSQWTRPPLLIWENESAKHMYDLL